MGCACEHKKHASELDRVRRLAKALAMMEGERVAIYCEGDGTYGFAVDSDKIVKPIIEYISRY